MNANMTNIQTLFEDMKRNESTRNSFIFTFRKKQLSFLFLADTAPYTLYISTFGVEPFTLVVYIDDDFHIRKYIESFSKLLSYLGYKYDPANKITPEILFEEINKYIPTTCSTTPIYSNVLRVAAACQNIEEKEKIYFCGWRVNPDNNRVSELNNHKTQIAFGHDIAKRSKAANVSSRWTAFEFDENLSDLNKFK